MDPFIKESKEYIFGKFGTKVISLPIEVTIEDSVRGTSHPEDYIHYLSCHTKGDKGIKAVLNFPNDSSMANSYAESLVNVLNEDITFKKYKKLKASMTKDFGIFLIHE
ncbi:hypothetical protein CL617_00040 [archaeon]|nr:hypothetical protein [archaeon]|tara:strand:- start:4969 stop:5292 length:324 start_codon:yes stop_codon:yes gene_type:complete